MKIYEKHVDRVIAHARKNYDKGWDIVLECMDRKEIKSALVRAGSVTALLKELKEDVKMYKEREQDACVGGW